MHRCNRSSSTRRWGSPDCSSGPSMHPGSRSCPRLAHQAGQRKPPAVPPSLEIDQNRSRSAPLSPFTICLNLFAYFQVSRKKARQGSCPKAQIVIGERDVRLVRALVVFSCLRRWWYTEQESLSMSDIGTPDGEHHKAHQGEEEPKVRQVGVEVHFFLRSSTHVEAF